MVYQEIFELEQFMDDNETKVDYNGAETCCDSITIKEIEEISGNKFDYENEILNKKLTYGDIKGSPALLNTLCEFYGEGNDSKNEYGATITPSDIVITNGAIGANFLTLYSLVGPGDHVIVVDPIYFQLQSIPKTFGAEVDIVNLKFENDFEIDVDAIAKLVKSNTKLIIINSPHNPSGVFVTDDKLLQIVDVAKKNDVYLLCDEVYRPLYHSIPLEENPRSIVNLYEKGISTGSLSKAFAAAGTRLGWIVSKDKELIKQCFIRRDFNIISISMLSDSIANYVLQNRKSVLKRNYELCQDNLQVLDEFIAKNSKYLSYVKPKSGTTAFVKVSSNGKFTTLDMCLELVNKYKILLVPGETFGHPGFIRIGYANNIVDLTKSLEAVQLYLNDKFK
ncbi:hypothetical protein BVG19_g4604 [[Candida] boidinii]|nr:hypothetical protein BVG19_g4604 [[Candida] boidinii]OWB51628.1 hypothetical protein B5S27_g3193 [[Candida] boidinii]